MFAVTTNDVPGYRITQVMGEVMGLTVRSANFGQNFTAGFRALGGGEMPEYTQVIYESRWEVMNRMWAEAQARGANAVIAMRFDSGSIGNFTEFCAYGTAVLVEPITQAPVADQAQGEHATPPQNPEQPPPGAAGQSPART